LREQALVISPLLFAGLLIAVFSIALRKRKSDAEKFLLCLFGSVFGFYAVLALNRSGEANWTATSYIGGVILVIADWRRRLQRQPRWMWAIAPALLVAFIQTALLHETAPLNLPAGMDPLDRARGWDGFGAHVEAARQKYHPDFIIGNKYQTASMASYYIPGKPTTYIVNSDEVENQFSFWPKYRAVAGSTALYITQTKNELPQNLRVDFRRIVEVDMFDTEANGKKLERFYLYFCEPEPKK
jgi:hypothetical protein